MLGRAAERLGDSNPVPHGREDDLLARMTAVWLRYTTAATLQTYVVALPFFSCLLSFGNRTYNSFFCTCSLLGDSPRLRTDLFFSYTPKSHLLPRQSLQKPETEEAMGSPLL